MVRSPLSCGPGPQFRLQSRNDHLSLARSPRAFTALVLALTAATLSACGSEDPQKLINETFNGTKNVHSGKVDVSLRVTPHGSPQLSQPFVLRVTGPVQSQGKGNLPKFDLGISVTANGRSLSASAVSTGQAGYVGVQGTAYQLAGSTFATLKQAYAQAQARTEQAKSGSQQTTAAGLGINPRTWLKDAKTEGSDQVGGTDTDHVSATIDVPKMLADVNTALGKVHAKGLPQAQQLPPSITPQQQKQITDAVKNATFDFWTGKDDKILRRLLVKLNFQVPASERSSTRGVTGGDLGFDYKITELNQPQSVSAPPNARPFSELGPALRSLVMGGAGAGGASGATGTPGAGAGAGGATAPGSAAQEAYVRCVQQAGGDLTKAQQCAALIQR
jgi:hypothetical protein